MFVYLWEMKKGDKFLTPSGIVEITSKARGGKSHGKGVRFNYGSSIHSEDFVLECVRKGIWKMV